MLRFLIKRNLSTLSTVMVLLWIFILPFLESWWYIYQIIQGNYAYQPDWKEKNDLRSSYKKFYIAVLFMRKQRWYRTYLSRSLLMADSIVLSGNFLQ